MKRLVSTVLGCGLIAATLAGASPAHAFLMATGAGMVAGTPTGASFISHTQGYAFNTDTVSSHFASTWIPRDVVSGGFTSTFNFSLKGNGQAFTCFIYATNANTGSVFSNSASTSVNGATVIGVSITPPSGGLYGWTGACNIPKQLPSNFARVYAIW